MFSKLFSSFHILRHILMCMLVFIYTQEALAPYQHIEEDLKSLKEVLEMKNQQIHQQEVKISELEKLVSVTTEGKEKVKVKHIYMIRAVTVVTNRITSQNSCALYQCKMIRIKSSGCIRFCLTVLTDQNGSRML